MRAAWWWIDRWQKSTAFKDMSLEEQGAYRNLLDELWLRDGALPADEKILARLCGDATAWPRIREAVMRRFIKTPEGWRNETHDEVASESERRRVKQRAYRDRLRSGNADGNKHLNVPPSPSPSPDLSPDTEKNQNQTQTAAPKRAARVVSPQDAAAKRLADTLGSNLNPCRKQISALLASGWDLPRVESAIDAHAHPGVAPWDWTKAATNQSVNGRSSADDRILAAMRANQQMHDNHKETA